MISLREVTPQNFLGLISLEVRAEQEEFVIPNAVSLAQAYVQKECIPMGIYNNDNHIGFLMYCLDSEDNNYWIYRFMIDRQHQCRGFGKKAFELLLSNIKEDKTKNQIKLGVNKELSAGVFMLEDLGFEFTGEMIGLDSIMSLKY